MDVTEFFSTTLPGLAALLFSHEVTPPGLSDLAFAEPWRHRD